MKKYHEAKSRKEHDGYYFKTKRNNNRTLKRSVRINELKIRQKYIEENI